MSADWYIARVEPGREQVAEMLLNRRGIQTYLPLKTVYRKRNRYDRPGEKRERLIALMTGYCFVSVPEDIDWFLVNTTERVEGILGNERGYYRLKDWVVPDLKARFGHVVPGIKAERWMRSYKEFKAGDLVTVVVGPFRNPLVPVRVESISGSAATILMHLFGALTRVRVPLDSLEAA